MEPVKLSPALLHAQVIGVATLGELLATLPSLDEMMTLLVSPLYLYWNLMDFTNELWDTLYRIDDTWRRHNVTLDDDDSPASLSRALAAFKSIPWSSRFHVTRAASEWQGSVSVLMERWAKLARAASQLHNTCREVATEAADMAATATARARELQDEAARDGTAQENMVELGQALGGEEGAEVVARHEASVRRDAMVASRRATMATLVRLRLEVALGLLERLVAACDEATAFPRELQRLLRDIKAALERKNKASRDVPEDLVAKVAVAEQLWEANARLAKDHLLGALQDIIDCYFHGASTSRSACGVAERCRRATEDIPRLLRPLEHPQGVSKVSPLSMEPQELSPALLQPQVIVVAILGELVAALPRRDEMLLLLMSAVSLYRDLEEFTNELRDTLCHIGGIWWYSDVTVDDDGPSISNDFDPPISLSRTLAAYKSTPGISKLFVKMEASKWQQSVDELVDGRARLARAATKLRNTCRVMVTEARYRVATAAAWARELQDEAARDGTAQENMVELGQALGREEGAEVVAGHESWVRREARVAASDATRATLVRQRVEAALGLLERLVAACNEATMFPQDLQNLLRVTRATLKGKNEASPDVPEDLVAKVAVAERLWEANTRLTKDHLVRTLPDITKFSINAGLDSPSACGVAERCQRAIEDIPKLLPPLACPQGVPKVSPVSMELQELSPDLLQPQVTVVAILGELLATLPSRDEEMLLMSLLRLYWDLEEFTRDLQVTLYCTDDTGRRHNVTMDDDDPVTSLSQALAAYKGTPWTFWKHVTMAASKWQQAVSVLVNSWAELAKKATELCKSWREVATKAADRAATAQARELQDEAAHDGTAQEDMVELGQAPGREEGAEVVSEHEAPVRKKARMAASDTTRATVERQWVEAALGLLERLVAACDEATRFPWELQHRAREIEAAIKGTNKVSPDVPEALVAKVAVATWLWEASARLVKDHLGATVQDVIDFYFGCGPDSPRCHRVAERCQRAMEDIPRLLRHPERPQIVTKVSPVSMELQELSPALLEPQVTMVAILGELLATLPRLDEMMLLLVSPSCLYWDLMDFTRELWATLYRIDDTWWCRNVTSDDDDPPTSNDDDPPTSDDDDPPTSDPPTSLSQALAAYKSTPWTTWFHVTMVASKWHRSVSVLVSSWAELARKATELPNTCRDLATKVADRAATAQARELQDVAACDGTGQENMVELGQALGGEEGAEVVAGHEAQVRRDARVAASKAAKATMVRQRLEAALGLLERLVAACNEATAFPRELQRLLRDIKAVPEDRNKASQDVPEDLVAKVAEAEQLWEANARLVKDHLGGTVQDIIDFLFTGGPTSPSGVAERCQRATQDIRRLVQLPECPQGVPKVSPVSMELQELSPALLQPQVTVVAILGKLLATLPRRDETLPVSTGCLYRDLQEFTDELWFTLYCTDDTWWHRNVTYDDDEVPPTSLSQALAAYKSTPWTPWKCVTMAASKWQQLVDELVDSWAQLARAATELHSTCREVAAEAADMVDTTTARARELQDKAAHGGTDQENMAELGQALGGEGHEAQVRREAWVAASKEKRATKVRQRVEEALGPLERLVAACDEAAAFPRELQCRVGDIKAALEGTNEASPHVTEYLVAKVAVAERLWETNAHLVKDHLMGALDDIFNFSFDGDPISHCQVAARCQRAIKDIPRLLQSPECSQSITKMSPVSMELEELSPALLRPQVTVVAILGELLATMPSRDKKMLPVSSRCLYWDLEEFTMELRATLYCTDDTWWRHNVTSNDGDPVTSLSLALATCNSIPWTPPKRVTMAASKWQGSVSVLVNSWAELARKATELRNAWREVATEAADRAATATARARELQDEAARDGTAQENMVELGQALGREEGAEVVAGHQAWVRIDAIVAAKQATRAALERQRVEAALGLLERLVAACDEATAFPWELQRRVEDIKATLEGTNEASPDVPEALVAKVAVAERLWEANTRLARDHLGGTIQDIIDFYFGCGPESPRCRRVAKRCQRAMGDIARLVQHPERPQRVSKVSPVSMEPQELSPALLQPQVTVLAILSELLATLPNLDEEMLPVSPGCLYWKLEKFTKELRFTLSCNEDTWWRNIVTSDDDGPVTSLSRALAAYKSIPWITWDDVTMVASKWQQAVSVLVNSWAELARKATELRNTCREVAIEAADMVATATARARELQDEAARDGTAQENMVELGQGLGGEEGAEVVARHEAQVRREARVAASEATRATMVRQRLEAALGLLERLVAACDEATVFPRELQHLLRDIKAAMKGTDEASPDVREDLVAKVDVAEQLWEANACLARDRLGGTLPDSINFLFSSFLTSPRASVVAKRCQRAIEDMTRLIQPPKCPQSVPKLSSVSMEPQELSPALLQPQVTVVAILDELLATLPRRDEEMLLPMSPKRLHSDLEGFTGDLWDTLYSTDDTWWRLNVTSDDDDPVTSLSRALASWESTPWTPRMRVTMAASEWYRSVAVLVNSWAELARKATELRNTCREVAIEAADMAATATARARELQDEAARDGTAQENMVELGPVLGREEGAEVVARHESQVRREAIVAASRAARATMERERLEAALGLLERLVAACDEATAFPRELQHLLRDTKAMLIGTNEVSPNVPVNLVAKVAKAEQLWEANARLVRDHLLGAVDDILKFHFHGGLASPSACGVAERCQRAMEDIPRLLQPPERPQSIPSVSPVSMELQELSPSQLLEGLVDVVATLGEVAATVTGPRRGVRRCVPPKSLHAALRNFTWSLRETLEHPGVSSLGDPGITSLGNSGVTSLGQALAALGATPGATWADVRAVGSAWWESVAAHEERWKQLVQEATKLRDACEDVAIAIARARDPQDKATCRGTAGDNLAATAQQLPLALDREEEASAGAVQNAQGAAATNEAVGEAVVATRRARAAIRRRHWAEVALGPLQRLVDASDKATEFISYTACQLRDSEAALEGTNEASPDVPEDLVAKVAEFEQLWEASARLFKQHLLGTLGDIHNLLLSPYGGRGGPAGSGSRAVAERCQRAVEDIPRLLQDSDITAAMSSQQ
ncbi:uncharacterized protein LOC119696576 isoform X3 [Motacilla alba alba]|uniref:uncharacterized protein LOC119696576 isoform X3 n=1 Tax=Motacilla alba alba TaxID=1094192 RepID=UPI0018D59CAB|nr:uncharacterized protein LOC119696576 isoform X3 [Motacilla alba alba]